MARKWEYVHKVIITTHQGRGGFTNLERHLEEFGNDGWELVSTHREHADTGTGLQTWYELFWRRQPTN